MNLRDFYRFAVQTGIANDPRGLEAVERDLKLAKERFEEAKGAAKEYFDKESMENPYSDTRILWGSGDEVVKTLLVGIDMEVGELVLADRLREKGKRLDLVFAHHPEGAALARLSAVMALQVELLTAAGVNVATAEALMEPRIREIERSLSPTNHNRPVDAARLLEMPYLCAHTVADNCVASFLGQRFEKEKPYRLKDIVDSLMQLPEYQAAARQFAGPRIISGDPGRRAGRIMLEMTGGTEGSKEIFASLETAGVSTLVSMHLTEAHLKAAKERHLNVVIAGHIASDNLGVNLLLDGIQKLANEELEILEASGFVRVAR